MLIKKGILENVAIGTVVSIAIICYLFSHEAMAASGLKVYVSLFYNGGQPVTICVSTVQQSAGCNTYGPSEYNIHQLGPFVFNPGAVAVGQEFKACASVKPGSEVCVNGVNSPQSAPERVTTGSLPSKTVLHTNFLWGAATSPYQVEGGISNNDWNFFTTTPAIKDRVNKLTSNTFFYQGSPIVLQPAGQAVKEWNLDYFQKDLDRAKRIGLNSLRIGIEWSRVEPQNNQWNVDAIQHYKQMITSMREKGITPIITLNHFTLPIWVLRPPTQFTKAIGQNFLPSPLKDVPLAEPPPTDGYWTSLRGWENPTTIQEFDEFVKKIVPEFKAQVDYWITLNEPVGSYIGLGYLAGLWSPGFFLDGQRAEKVLHNLIQAHVDAYNIISASDNVDADEDGVAKSVGFSHAMTYVKPAKSITVLVDNSEAAKNFNYFTNDYFLNAVVNGEEDLNYVKTLQRHNTNSRDLIVHENWRNKVDFIGVNYYRAMYVRFDPILALSSARFVGGVPLNDLRLESQPHGKLNDLGWEIYPEGLYKLMLHIKDQWNKPILITENGIPDKFGNIRAPYIISHLLQVKKAIDSGVKVMGYLYWSLTDNYEWQAAYSPEARFGLYYVNRNSNNLERILTEGAKALQSVIHQNTDGIITDSSISKAGEIYGTFSPDGMDIIHPITSDYINSDSEKKLGSLSPAPQQSIETTSESNKGKPADASTIKVHVILTAVSGNAAPYVVQVSMNNVQKSKTVSTQTQTCPDDVNTNCYTDAGFFIFQGIKKGKSLTICAKYTDVQCVTHTYDGKKEQTIRIDVPPISPEKMPYYDPQTNKMVYP